MPVRKAGGAALAALALLPASAAGAVTVAVEDRCYAEGDEIALTGAGFTPDGPVRLALERADGDELETSDTPVARSDGTLGGDYGVKDETGWFGSTQTRFDMDLRLTDRTSGESGIASFIFSRWNVGVRAAGGKLHPKRPARLLAIGYTDSIGKPLYAHWIRDGRRVHTRRLGRLKGPCGDVTARLARGFPFRPVARGAYEVRFSPSRTDTRTDAIRHAPARVTRRIPRDP